MGIVVWLHFLCCYFWSLFFPTQASLNESCMFAEQNDTWVQKTCVVVGLMGIVSDVFSVEEHNWFCRAIFFPSFFLSNTMPHCCRQQRQQKKVYARLCDWNKNVYNLLYLITFLSYANDEHIRMMPTHLCAGKKLSRSEPCTELDKSHTGKV
jgi:hypothetical protein